MDDGMVSVLCYLMWADSDDIRNAAGDFVTLAKFQEMLPKDGEGGSELDQGRSVDAEKVILSLVAFFKKHGDQQLFRVKLLLLCFWEKTPALRRWEVFCDLLQRGERQNTTQLDSEDQNILIHFLIYALELTRGSEKNQQKSQYLALSGLLFKSLPTIFRLFKQSTVLLTSLATLIPYLDLTAISSKDIRGSIAQLLAVLKDVFTESANADLIMKLGRALDHLCSTAHPLQKEAKEQLTHMIDEVTRDTNEALKSYILEDSGEDVLETSLTRTASLLAIQDIVDEIGTTPFKDISALVSRYRADTVRSTQVAKSCLLIVFYCHLWHLGRVTRQPKLLESYLIYRDLALDQFAATVDCRTSDLSVRRLAFKLLCETVMLNSGQATQGCAVYYSVGGDLVRVLCEFSEEMEAVVEPLKRLSPQGAFVKLSAKTDTTHEDADENSQELTLLLARIICNCPSVTVSQLPSSYLALFGTSNYRFIAGLVKQVVSYLKSRDLQQSGVFKDNGNYFSILLDAMMKSFGDRKKDSLGRVKDLARRISSQQGSGPLKPKQAERLKEMVYEGITFSLSCHENFVFLEALTSFLNKGFMTPAQMQEIYERVTKDLQKMHEIVNQEAPGRLDLLLPLTNFHGMLARLSGNRLDMVASAGGRKPRVKGIEGPKKNEPEPVVSAIVKSDDEEEEPERAKRERPKSKKSDSDDEYQAEPAYRTKKAAKKSAIRPDSPPFTPPVIIEACMRPPKVDFNPLSPSRAENEEPPQRVKKAAKKSALANPPIKEEPGSDSDTLEINAPPVQYQVDVNKDTLELTFTPGKRPTREPIYDMDEEVEEPTGRSRKAAIRRRLEKHRQDALSLHLHQSLAL